MKKISPKQSKTTFVYDCPHCDFELEISSKVASNIGKYVCDFCDEIVYLEKINVSYSSVQKQDRSTTPNNDHPLKDDCVSALVNLGYKKKEATDLVDMCFEDNDPVSIDDALNLIFSKNEECNV